MSRLANALIVAGVVILLAVGGYVGWQTVRGQQLRTALQQTPAPSAISPSATPVAQASAPTSPPASPTTALSPAPTAAPATVAPAPQPTRPQPTATSAPTATPAPSPEPVAGGPPVRLVIPAPISIDAQVVEMGWHVEQGPNGPQSVWDLDKLTGAVGHHLNSAELGTPGNIVISGHNNIPGSDFFGPISQSWPTEPSAIKRIDETTERSDYLNGQIIQLYNASGQRFDYVIKEFYRLKDTGVSLEQRIANGRFMQPTDDARLTLVTCWPIWSNTHRLIVVAEPVKPS